MLGYACAWRRAARQGESLTRPLLPKSQPHQTGGHVLVWTPYSRAARRLPALIEIEALEMPLLADERIS